jgi:acyl dehydratase
MTDLHFSELRINDSLPTVSHAINQDTIDLCAVAHLDYNPVHTDVEWCKTAQVFGTPKTVAHGMFTMSLMTSVVLRAWQRAGAFINSIDAKLTRPVEVGQTLRCDGKVIELHPRGPGQSFVVVGLTAINTQGDTVGVGQAQVTIPD